MRAAIACQQFYDRAWPAAERSERERRVAEIERDLRTQIERDSAAIARSAAAGGVVEPARRPTRAELERELGVVYYNCTRPGFWRR